MELLGDVDQVEARFVPFADNFNLGARQVHGLRQMHYGLINHFGFTRWYTDVTWVKWILVLVQLEIVLVSTQDRSMGCDECTIGSEISLDAPDGTPT